MKFEVEVISEELLPAIRSIMTTRMKEQYGLKQREIASRLEITQPAVSQYLNENRAKKEIIQKIKQDPQTDILIEDAVSKAVNEENYSKEVSQTIETIRDKGLIKEHFQNTEKILGHK